MKKLLLSISFICFFGCSHTSEQIIGYNEHGQTIVKVCHTRGNLVNSSAFGSNCVIELRDYGRITKNAETINIISDDNR